MTAMLAAMLCLLAASPAQAELPADFPLSSVSWGGIGGASSRNACPPLAHHPVILVHDDGEGPEAWAEGMGALAEAGFGACELWAVKLGDQGQPMRSVEELTDDLAFFMGSVLQYTGAPRVQLVGRGVGAVLAHTTLAKYRLHGQVHSAVWLDGPFQGLSGCDDGRCLGGEVRCCSLQPGSLMLRKALLPLEAPQARELGSEAGRPRYLTLGSSPRVDLDQRTPELGGWMLDGAANLRVSPEALASPWEDEALWTLLVEALSDPATACVPADDRDGDGFCAAERGGADCDDDAASVHPGAEEIERDGIDQNCNGHDVDRSIPGWACERPLLTEAPAPPPPAEPPAQEEEPEARGGLLPILLVVLLAGALFVGLRSWRGGTGAAVLVAALSSGEARTQEADAEALPPLPAEYRFAILGEPAQGELRDAVQRCKHGRFQREPMPDRHPHREPEGPHYRDLGFLAIDELDEPYRSALQEMERTRQGCVLLDAPAGPVVLARLEGIPGSPFSEPDQDAWRQRRERREAMGRLSSEVLPAAARERGLVDGASGAKPDSVDVAGGLGWVGSGAFRRPVQVEALRLDRASVTVGAFRHFAESAGYQPDPRSVDESLEGDAPAAWVDLADAWAYCRWAGGRVATADEWQWASPEVLGREWTTTTRDGVQVTVAGADEAWESWQLRAADLGFRCAH